MLKDVTQRSHLHRIKCCDNILLFLLRSVQMRLYSMHKREFVMVFLAFFACFGLGLFIGLAGNNSNYRSV
jgi:hypothetical protein